MKMLAGIFIAVMIGLGWGSVPVGYAQENQDFLSDLNELRDPFQPQLPAPEVSVPIAPSAVSQNTNPSAPYVDPQPVVQLTAPSVPTNFVTPGTGGQQQAQDAQAVVINGLVWNTDVPQAIVNDHVVKVGDMVDGMKVISIRQKGIEFFNNGMKVFIDVSDD